MTTDRIASIQALRGIAVLMVCALHFCGAHNALAPEWVKSIAAMGRHGVTMFFVISGFVLPLALSRVDYSIASFPRFGLKRLVRLEPPYLATILIVVLLNIAASNTPGFQGRPYSVDFGQLAAHLGYLAPVVGKPWILGVFWSLLIEVEFYILIGLTFPLFRARPVAWIVALAIPAALATDWRHLPYHLPVFLIGTTAFAWRAGMLGTRPALAICAGFTVFLGVFRGTEHAAFAVLAAGYILWANPRSRVLLFMGTISYSLYLIHVPFGVKAIHLVERHVGWVMAAAIGLAAAIGAAWMLWALIERRAMKWASRIGYESPPRRLPKPPEDEVTVG